MGLKEKNSRENNKPITAERQCNPKVLFSATYCLEVLETQVRKYIRELYFQDDGFFHARPIRKAE